MVRLGDNWNPNDALRPQKRVLGRIFEFNTSSLQRPCHSAHKLTNVGSRDLAARRSESTGTSICPFRNLFRIEQNKTPFATKDFGRILYFQLGFARPIQQFNSKEEFEAYLENPELHRQEAGGSSFESRASSKWMPKIVALLALARCYISFIRNGESPVLVTKLPEARFTRS